MIMKMNGILQFIITKTTPFGGRRQKWPGVPLTPQAGRW